MASTIWNGTNIKALLPALQLAESATISSGTVDPITTPTAGTRGDLYITTGSNAAIYQKVTTDGTDTNWTMVLSSLGPLADNSVVVTNASGIPTTDAGITYASSILTVPTIDTSSIQLPTSGVLAIGNNGNATTINIGTTGSTINLQGNTVYQDVTNLNVANKQINLNTAGGAGTATNSGIEIEENGTITGYAETSSDRNSWIFLAPNTTGVATITPGSAGITLNQSSHNPVTIGSPANGLSVNGTQVVSLGSASTSTTGALTSTDWNTFNNKQNALTIGNITDSTSGSDGISITGGTGAIIGTGVAIAQQVATTSENGYLASTDWNTFNSKQPAGNYITSLTGDVSASGPGAATSSLVATSNSTLTTLSALTTASSLTSVGTITSGVWNGTAVPITNGGTGQITANAALNALLPSQSSNNTYFLQTNGTNTSWATLAAPGDITQTSFSMANNTSSVANVTGLAFSNSVVRSAQIQYSITVIATSNLYEQGVINIVQRGSDWSIARSFDGDDTLTNFSVTTSGQVQYTNSNYSGFSSGTMKYRALTTSI